MTPRPNPYQPSLPNSDEKKLLHHYCCDQGKLSSRSQSSTKHKIITAWSSTAIYFFRILSFLKKHLTCNVNANWVETSFTNPGQCAECARTHIGQRVDPWTIVFENTVGLWKTATLGPLLLLSMCSHQTIKWIYRRPWWLTPTTTLRPTACWSPGTSSTTSPHSTGRAVLCQDSMLHYWPGHASIWHHPIIVLLLL